MIWERSIQWHKTGDARFPWKAQVDGKAYVVKVNEFPVEEFVYSLVIDGGGSFGFNEWPASWFRPADIPASEKTEPVAVIDEHEKATFDAETEWALRASRIKPSDKIK